MRSLAKEYGPQNIRVNAICPGISDTDVGRATDGWGDPDKVLNAIRSATPLKKLIEPIDIANAALFLASDEGRLVHSVTLCVDGGGAF
jgi:3-oxoacyl-[acyl-carrier protein] reductase